nr:hypothetical protein [Candidatus Njordarchaeota archaeon]
MRESRSRPPVFPSLAEAIEDIIQLCQKMRSLMKAHEDVGDPQQHKVLGMIMASLIDAKNLALYGKQRSS